MAPVPRRGLAGLPVPQSLPQSVVVSPGLHVPLCFLLAIRTADQPAQTLPRGDCLAQGHLADAAANRGGDGAIEVDGGGIHQRHPRDIRLHGLGVERELAFVQSEYSAAPETGGDWLAWRD